MTDEPRDLTRYFDGEVERDALAPEIRARAERFERLIAGLDRGSVRLPSSVTAAVMSRIRAEPRTWTRRVWRWAFDTRAIRVSPAVGALALAAAAVGVLLAGATLGSHPSQERAVTRFVYVAPGARSVAVTGDFVHWDSQGIALRRRSGDVWTVELELVPGLHHYVFVVDGGEWHADPNGSLVEDGFGRENSIVLVPAGSAS